MRWWLAATLAFAINGLIPARAAIPPKDSNLINSIGEYRQVASQPVRSDYLINLEAVVTYSDPLWKWLYVQDASGSIQVHADSLRYGFEVGQKVAIEGAIKAGVPPQIKPLLTDVTLTSLGKTKLLEPLEVAESELFQRPLDTRFVALRGVVRSYMPAGRLRIELQLSSTNIPVLVRFYQPVNLNQLMDAQIQVVGVCLQEVDSEGKVTGVAIYVDDFQWIKIERPGMVDPYAAPLVSLPEIAKLSAAQAVNRRVLVQGRCVSQDLGHSLQLADGSGQTIKILSTLQSLYESRDWVQAVGYLVQQDNQWALDDAMLKVEKSILTNTGSAFPPPSPQDAVNPNIAVLTEIKEVLKLSKEEARKRYPVRVRGVITFADAYENSLFLQDGDDGIYLMQVEQSQALKAGQLAEVTGVTLAGGVLNMITVSKVVVLGEGVLPAPVAVGYHQAMSGEFDSRRVRFKGVIQSGEALEDRLLVDLVAADGRVQCWVLMPPAQGANFLAKLLDSVIEVEGVCLVEINRAGQASAIRLAVAREQDFKIIERAPEDAFAAPLYSNLDALGFLPKNVAGRRIRVQGVVTLWRRGKELCLQDKTGGVRAITDKTNELMLGTVVELVGFRTYADYTPVLRNVDFRVLNQPGPVIKPQLLTVKKLLEDTNSYDHMLVTIEAELLRDVARSQVPELLLQQGNVTFTAAMEQLDKYRYFPALRAGSILRVTGVCYPRISDSQTLVGFRLGLRQPEDIEVVKPASWMTSPRVALVAVFLLLILAGAVAWAAYLHRQVGRQMDTIRQRFEREALLEARCAQLIERANDIIVSCDPQGRITALNQAAERVLGYTLAEALNLEFWHIVAPWDRPRLQEIFQGRQLELLAHTYELEVFAKNGRKLTLEVSTQFLRNNGRIAGIESIARDITERKRNEERIRQSETQLAEAQRIGHVGSWEFNSLDKTVRLSAEARRLLDLGESTEVCRAGRLFARLNPAGVKVAKAALRRLLHGEMDVGMDQRIQQPHGPDRVVHCRMEAQFDIAGRCLRLKGTIHDITERDHAQEQLRMLSQAVEQSPAMVMITDTHGAIEYVNQRFVEVTGYSGKEVMGKNPRVLKSGNTPRHVYQGLWASILAGQPWAGELQNRKKNGDLYDEQQVISPIKDRQGRTIRFLALKEDITERKRSEALKTHLESQLRQAQKMEGLGTLAGGIAHDFNNILGAIAGYNELARLDSQDRPEILESLEQIGKASVRAKDLVQQILAFSRQTKQERKPVRLQTIVKESLKLLRSTLPATIEILPEFPEEALVVMADPIQIHQVTMNLCANAAHAMRNKPGQLHVRLKPCPLDAMEAQQHPDLKAGEYAQLLVSDTGHGMDESTLKRIFDPFFTTKAPGEGTGLGLAVVHGIVKDHGGAILVESTPQVGTTFQIFFPIHATKETHAVEVAETAPRGNGETILFVDDEPALCMVAQRLLQNWDYHVTIQHRAADALEQFRAQPGGYDLVITDLSMPGMSGVDFASELFKIRPDLPIILASGFAGAWTNESVKSIGVREVMIKPISPTELRKAVHRVLHGSQDATAIPG